MTTHFRITAWPGEPIEVPSVMVPGAVELRGEMLHFPIGAAAKMRRLPAEFYLREARDLDLADLDAVAGFVGEFGYVAPHDLQRDLPHPNWRQGITRFSAIRGRHYVPDRGAGIAQCHIDDTIYRLTLLRALTDHAIAYRDGNQDETRAWDKYLVEPLDHDWTDPDPDDPRWKYMRPPQSPALRAWEEFTRILNAALREFHVRVAVEDPNYPAGQPGPYVYEAAALQLVNDLCQEDTLMLRRCAHCGREFYRQVGRSKVQSRLEGVKYCTPECGRAAGVKAFRARKRAERKADGQHPEAT